MTSRIHKLAAGALLTAALGFLASPPAQNARITALGGNFLVDDVSKVSGYPSIGAVYCDFVQASANADGSAGPALGMKSLGKWGAAGLVANQESTLFSDFYHDAKLFMDSIHLEGDSLPDAFTSYPHLLLSVALPWVDFGFDLFYESAKRNYSYATADGKNRRYRAEITNLGLLASASIEAGAVNVYPFFDFSIPKAIGSAVIPDSISEETGTIRTSNMMAHGLGLEIGADFKPAYLCAGVYYAVEQYQFFRYRNTVRYCTPRNRTDLLNAYGGLVLHPTEKLMTSVAYSFERMAENDLFEDTIDSYDETLVTISHQFIGSAEYVWSPKRFFDAVAFRGGLSCRLTFTSYSARYESSPIPDKEDISYPAQFSDVAPTIGMGVERNGIGLDVAANLGGWTGILSGPPVIMGTVTWFFSGEREKEESREE